MKELKKVMEAIELLQKENLISEKVATKYLTDYLEKRHAQKQEEIRRLSQVSKHENERVGYQDAKYGQE